MLMGLVADEGWIISRIVHMRLTVEDSLLSIDKSEREKERFH